MEMKHLSCKKGTHMTREEAAWKRESCFSGTLSQCKDMKRRDRESDSWE